MTTSQDLPNTRFMSIHVENYLNVRLVDIQADRNLIQITGKNEQGKSSIIKAFYAALKGKRYVPTDAVHHGAEEARIRLDLGEVVIRLIIDKDDEPYLVVESEKGARWPSPQKLLDKLIKAVSFDPSEFIRMERKAQFESLAKLVGLSDLLTDTAFNNKKDFDKRAEINRDIKALEGKLSGGRPPAGVRVDVGKLVAQVKEIGVRNATRTDESRKRERERSDIEQTRLRIASKREEIARLLADVESAEQAVNTRFEKLSALEPVDDIESVDDLNLQIVGAEEQNRRVDALEGWKQMETEAAALQASADKLTERMKKRTEEQMTVIAATPMPIPGLGFKDGGVTYNGVPFENAAESKQLLTAAAIGMSGDPPLKLMLLSNASAFDDETLNDLDALAREKGFYVLAESVSNHDKVGIVIRAGIVAKVNPPREIVTRLKDETRPGEMVTIGSVEGQIVDVEPLSAAEPLSVGEAETPTERDDETEDLFGAN